MCKCVQERPLQFIVRKGDLKFVSYMLLFELVCQGVEFLLVRVHVRYLQLPHICVPRHPHQDVARLIAATHVGHVELDPLRVRGALGLLDGARYLGVHRGYYPVHQRSLEGLEDVSA